MTIHDARGQKRNDPSLDREYAGARAFGSVRVGAEHLFFRAGLRVYALSRGEIRRCYRRVMRVPMKMCCGTGSLDVENLVVEGEAGELAQIQLPGTRAAVALMEELKAKMPEVDFNLPAKPANAEARP